MLRLFTCVLLVLVLVDNLAGPMPPTPSVKASQPLTQQIKNLSSDLGKDILSVTPGLPPVTGPAPAVVNDAAPKGNPDDLTILVSDPSKALAPPALKQLKDSVTGDAQSTGIRFSVNIIPTLKKERIDSLAVKKSNAQGLDTGRDAVLMLLAVQEKQGWLWGSPGTGTGLTEGIRQAIISYIIQPNMKQGNIARAAEDGARAAAMALQGAYAPKAVQVAQPAPAGVDFVPGGFLPTLVGGAFLAMLLGGGAYAVPMIAFRRV